jgi:hypothetical protein
MGQAKRRGTFEQCVQQAQLAQQVIEKAFPESLLRNRILYTKFGGNERAFAFAIIEKQKQAAKTLTEQPKSPIQG